MYVSFAQFELSVPEEDAGDSIVRARAVFENAYKTMKQKELKEEVSSIAFTLHLLAFCQHLFIVVWLQRVILLESWKDFEENHGTAETLEMVKSKMPRTVKRSKKRKTEGGEGEDNVVYEEYYDYIFPDDETQKPNLKLLQMAHAWAMAKQKQESTEQAEPAAESAEPDEAMEDNEEATAENEEATEDNEDE